MRVLEITVFSGLLIFTTSVRGPEQSLIGRSRHTNELLTQPGKRTTGSSSFVQFPDFPPSSFKDDVKKVTLGSSSNPVSMALDSTPVIYPVVPAQQASDVLSRQEAANVLNRQQEQQELQALKGNQEIANEMFEGLGPSQIDLELRIPTSLQKIQDGRIGPLSAFLDTVQSELCKVGKLSNSRLQLLGIRGEYTRVPLNQSGAVSLTGNDGMNSSSWGEHHIMTMADQYVIIDLEVLPGSSGLESTEPTTEEIFSSWKTQLSTAGSPLLKGPLGMIFNGAKIQKPSVNMGLSSSTHFTNAFKSSAVQLQSLSWALVLLSFLVDSW